MPHKCHARGCEREIPPKLFMCPAHWKLVPKRLKEAVWREYRPGQERGEAQVTKEYLAVADEAIRVVAAKESIIAG